MEVKRRKGLERKGLERLLTVKKNAAPRCPVSLSFSAHVWAMADLPTPAGPLIQYIDEGELADSVTQFVMSAIYCSRVPGKQRRS